MEQGMRINTEEKAGQDFERSIGDTEGHNFNCASNKAIITAMGAHHDHTGVQEHGGHMLYKLVDNDDNKHMLQTKALQTR
jgi:hypothetical protein